MSRITMICIILILLVPTAHGASMRMCTDKDGHKTFTQGNCPKNTSRKSIEVQPAQSPVTAIRINEKKMLFEATQKRRAQSQPQPKQEKKRVVRRSCGG